MREIFSFSNLGIRIFRAARNFNCVISAFPVEVSSSPPGIHSFLEGTATATGSQLTRTLPPFVSAPATVSLLPSAFGSLTSGAALSAIFSDGTKLKVAEFLPFLAYFSQQFLLMPTSRSPLPFLHKEFNRIETRGSGCEGGKRMREIECLRNLCRLANEFCLMAHPEFGCHYPIGTGKSFKDRHGQAHAHEYTSAFGNRSGDFCVGKLIAATYA